MTLNQAFGLFLILVMLVGAVWVYILILKKCDDPKTILVKTLITLGMVVYFLFNLAPMVAAGGPSAIAGLLITLVIGVIAAILWRHHIIELIVRPFTSLFTGGSTPPDPEPFYSIARTKRMQQRYDEAIEAIEEQLERFPDDFTGLLMLAEIQAVNQHNLSGATDTINLVCEAHREVPGRVFSALSSLADWQLQIGNNRDAALRAFEKVKRMFPNHPVALEADQRIAHLPTQEMIDGKDAPRIIELKEMPKVVIRDPSEVKVEIKEETPDEAIGRLVNHLEIHPQDRAAREELAGHYANHLKDAQLAIEQLEWLTRQPGQDKANIVRWLNRIADYHIRLSGDVPAAERVMDRIAKRYPKSSVAEQAMRRRMLLTRELKGNEKSRDIHLGSYERDLGLR